MGTVVSIVVRRADPLAAAQGLDAAFGVLRAADARFSPFDPGSELSRLDRGELAPDAVSRDMREVLAIAERARAASGGAFDVRTPEGRLDTNGVVKGWAAQRAADRLVAAGVRHFCLNAGGDVVAHGEPEPGRGWRVAVRAPQDRESVLAVLDVRDGAVATSGTYERGAHVWDGRTGSRDVPLAAATVVAADLTTADVLATAVLAMGADGAQWAASHGAVAVLVVPAATPAPAGERALLVALLRQRSGRQRAHQLRGRLEELAFAGEERGVRAAELDGVGQTLHRAVRFAAPVGGREELRQQHLGAPRVVAAGVDGHLGDDQGGESHVDRGVAAAGVRPVDHHGAVRLGEHHVGGVQVQVQHRTAVRRLDRVQPPVQVGQDLGALAHGDDPGGERLEHRRAVEPLHEQVGAVRALDDRGGEAVRHDVAHDRHLA